MIHLARVTLGINRKQGAVNQILLSQVSIYLRTSILHVNYWQVCVDISYGEVAVEGVKP